MVIIIRLISGEKMVGRDCDRRRRRRRRCVVRSIPACATPPHRHDRCCDWRSRRVLQPARSNVSTPFCERRKSSRGRGLRAASPSAPSRGSLRRRNGRAARTEPVATRHSYMPAHHLPKSTCPARALTLVLAQHGTRGSRRRFRLGSKLRVLFEL